MQSQSIYRAVLTDNDVVSSTALQQVAFDIIMKSDEDVLQFIKI